MLTTKQIESLFIRAMETDRKLPQADGPKSVKSASLPYWHDQTDMNGWGGERYQQHRADFWAGLLNRAASKDVTDWELAIELMRRLVSEKNRKPLWAWAQAKAGGKSFASWCRQTKVSETWATTLKNRAINEIATGLELKTTDDCKNDQNTTLPDWREINDNQGTIGKSKQEFWWSSDPAFDVPEMNPMRKARRVSRPDYMAA